MHFFNKCLAILILSFCLTGNSLAGEKLSVFVSIAPQKYFVQQIGKDLVTVQVMVPPGASPHSYEPKPKQMVAIARSKIYFAIGVPFENAWLPKLAAANPKMKVVPTDNGIVKIPMASHSIHDDQETAQKKEVHLHGGDTAPHDDGGLDPHTWLAPPLVKIQADAILAGLKESDPAHADVYEFNHRHFIAELNALDIRLKRIFSESRGLQFMVFHPSWGYFARAYGLEQICIEMEGKAPKPAQLKALIEHARKRGIKVIFAQPQFSTKSAGLVAKEINGQVIYADPLAEDWMANLNAVAEKFKLALK